MLKEWIQGGGQFAMIFIFLGWGGVATDGLNAIIATVQK
jgi:hypothetical protein